MRIKSVFTGLILVCFCAVLVQARAPTDRAWNILKQGVADKSYERRDRACRTLALLTGNQTAQQMAEKALAQFTRITLAPQEWQDVTVHVAPRELSYWDTTQHNWVFTAGQRSVYVGSSSRDIRLEGTTPQ